MGKSRHWLSAPALLLLSVLVACATSYDYGEAPVDNRARVRFALERSTGWADVTVYRYDSADCTNEAQLAILYDHFVAMARPGQRLNMPLSEYGDRGATELFMPGGATTYFLFTGTPNSAGAFTTAGQEICGVVVEAEFEPGSDYELVYEQGCGVTLYQLVATHEGVSRQQLRRFDDRVTSDGCDRAFNRLRL